MEQQSRATQGLIKRRSSLNELREVEEEERIEGTQSNSLKFLETKAESLTKRCNQHERTITSLENDIESKIKEWDSIIHQLQKLDDEAQGLTDQIRTTLENLKSTSSFMPITASKISAKNVGDRVEVLKLGFEGSLKRINGTLKGLEVLEKILMEEEGSLAAEAKQSSTLQIFLYVSVAGSIASLAWYYRYQLDLDLILPAL